MTNIIVIESNRCDQERLRSLLTNSDRQVAVCQEGLEALQIINDSGKQIDLVIVLWELLGAPTGAELLAHVRRARSSVPVIVTSGLFDLTRVAAAKQLGARDFLLKPLDRKRLLSAVESALTDEEDAPLVEALGKRIIGKSAPMLAIFRSLAKVIARPTENVLLCGKSGTGKELLAAAIHGLGQTPVGPWVAVNLGEIPTTLSESHFFGHEAGAFTDAKRQRIGYFEESEGGVLFLDEIGDLQLPLQVKLLRVIQERTFRRLGGGKDLKFTGRLVCATNRDLVADVREGQFREDLYYRIAAHEIRVPSLCERGDDLWLLTDHFLRKYGGERNIRLTREARELLSRYAFPGNVRELEDIIKSAVIQSSGSELSLYCFPVDSMKERQVRQPSLTGLDEIEWPVQLFTKSQKDAMTEIENAFDRKYLPRKLEEAKHNIELATEKAGWKDDKTFRDKWKQAGMGSP
ncbi:MAG: sigma-54-dependent Fis family transcriptional regulator [Verrucomicrobia bacterium]|nr:sigma-54-dependent Fis family transcriptional regulator [Verrucomicrobiota bacterium]